jgi:ABC-2 type transport system permease protein
MPVPAQLVSQALPLTHFLRIVRGITLKGALLADVASELVWLCGLFAVLVLLSSLRFSKKLT